MRLLFFLLFFFLSIVYLQAQNGALTGRILNEMTKEGIPECHVFIPNTTFQAFTDSLGNFSISEIPEGPWQLFAVKNGFETSFKNLQIQSLSNPLENWELRYKATSEVEELKEYKVKKAKEHFEGRMGIDTKGSELVLVNPEVLIFYEKEGTGDIWVDFSDLLMVQNLKMGYLIAVWLREPLNLSRKVESSELLFSYLEMDFGSVEEKNLINSNRVEIYQNSPVFAIRKLIGDKSGGIEVFPGGKEGAFFLQAKSPIEIKESNQKYRYLAFNGGGIEIRANGAPVFPELLKTQGFVNSDYSLKSLPLDFNYDKAIALREVDRSLEALQERVFLHTDKEVYMMGEQLLFKAYLLIGNPLLMEESSKVLHVEIVDPNGYRMQHKVFPIENGKSSGAIYLGPELNTKDFIVKAYTLWGSNYGVDSEYYKPIQVMSSLWEMGENAIEPKSDGVVVFSDKQVYQSQDSVTLNVVVNNQNGSIAAGNLSIAVVEENGVQSLNPSEDLLKDFIQHKSQISEVDTLIFEFEKEYAISLRGKIHDSVPMISSSFIEVLINGFLDKRELKANSFGEFFIKGLNEGEDFSVLVKASSRNGLPLNDLELDLLESRNNKDYSQFAFGSIQPLPKRPQKIDSLISNYLKMREGEILLDEVEVEDERDDDFGTMPYGKPQSTLEMEGIYLSGLTDQFIYTIANRTGFQAGGIPPMIINKRGDSGGPPLILLNGSPITPVSGTTFGSGYSNSQYMALQSINVFTIKKIEYIRSIVTVYGDGGRWGVINIVTKTGAEIAKDMNTYQEFEFSGLEEEIIGPITDFESDNSTFYWNPNVEISSFQTSATLKFKLPENPGPFWVIVNGVNSSGEPVSGRFLMNQKSLGEIPID